MKHFACRCNSKIVFQEKKDQIEMHGKPFLGKYFTGIEVPRLVLRK